MNTQTLYKIFRLIKNEMDWKKNTRGCQAILENTYYILNTNHWKVLGITKSAYDLIAKNDFNVSKDGRSIVCRAHIYERRETFLNIMNKNWKNGKEIYNYILSRDVCYLSAKNENKKEIQLENYIVVPKELNLFMPKAIGFSYDKIKERAWLVNLAVR